MSEQREAAGGVIVRSRISVGYQVVLILVNNSNKNRWRLPKGHIEKDERAVDAACREVKEETGYDVESFDFICTVVSSFTLFRDGACSCPQPNKIASFFLLKVVGGHHDLHEEDVKEVRWFNINDAIDKIWYEDEKSVLLKAKELLNH